MSESPSGRVVETQQPFVVSDLDAESSYPDVMELLRQENIRSFCLIPLTTAQRRLGAIGFGKIEPHHYDAYEVEFMQQVARQVAVAVDNTLNFEAAQAYQEQLARERDRLRVLLDVNNALVTTLDLQELFQAIANSLRRVLHHDYTSLALADPVAQRLRVVALDFPKGHGLIRQEMSAAIEDSPAGAAYLQRVPQRFVRADLGRFNSDSARLLLAEGVRTVCFVPLITRERVLGTIGVASLQESAFPQQDIDLLTQVAAQVAIAVENALALRTDRPT